MNYFNQNRSVNRSEPLSEGASSCPHFESDAQFSYQITVDLSVKLIHLNTGPVLGEQSLSFVLELYLSRLYLNYNQITSSSTKMALMW